MQAETIKNFMWILVGLFLGAGIPMLTPNSPINGWVFIVIGILIAVLILISDAKSSRLKSLKSAIRDSKCVWAFWYTGNQVLIDNIIKTGKPTSIKKLILLKPELNSDAFNYLTTLAGEDTPTKRNKDIADVKSVIEMAKSTIPKGDIYYHSEKLTYSFTIFDKTPQVDGGNLVPNSKNAWVVIQPLEPKRAMEKKDWHKWVVKNKGKTQDQFEAYYHLFLEIESRAELLDASVKTLN